MMRFIVSLPIVFAVLAIGCSKAPTIKDAPVSVAGKVSQGGKPVGNIVLSFHPLDNGHLKTLPVKSDGSFAGELIGGNYSYFVDKSLTANSPKLLMKFDPKYYEPALDRTVNVEFGKDLILALD